MDLPADDHSDRGDAALVREGVVALRAWFFTTVGRTSDPTDVTGTFPSFPEVELLNEMDAPPEGYGEPPPGAMSIFDFYKSFVDDASKSPDDADARVATRATLALRARECLHLSPEFKTAPHVNVGVRFLFHLAHALKTLTPPGPMRVDADPQMVVDMPLNCARLLHMIPPHLHDKPTKKHKTLWADPERGKYNAQWFFVSLERNFKWTQAVATVASDAFTLGVRCPACKCDSDVAGRGDAIAAMETQSSYLKTMAKFSCPHCGLGISCLNPNVEILFGGLEMRE